MKNFKRIRADLEEYLNAAADTFSQPFAQGTPVFAWALQFKEKQMRIITGDYGSNETRPLTTPARGAGFIDDPTLDKSLVRPMDMRSVREIDGVKSSYVSEAAKRKTYPLYSGVLKYFPDALAEVAHLSKVGNDQHNPGEPLHWAREKSQDQLDALARHLKDHASGIIFDTDKERHLTKVAWRALAELQLEIEREKAYIEPQTGAKPGSVNWIKE